MTGYIMYNRYIIFTCHYQQYNYTFRLHVKITEHNFTSFIYLFSCLMNFVQAYIWPRIYQFLLIQTTPFALSCDALYTDH